MKTLSFNEYQEKAFSTAQYPEKNTGSSLALSYCGLGLGESGEVQGKLKKVIRDYDGKVTVEIKEAIICEVGDVLWYLAALATELNVSLEEIAAKNLAKLADRHKRGVISGSGDYR